MRTLTWNQNSDAWQAARRGRITASNMGKVMDFTQKGVEGAKRMEYRLKLLGERLTDWLATNYVTRAMEEGKEREEEALSLYEQATGEVLTPMGFILHPEYDFAGASPDSAVGHVGLVEAKSPQPHTLLGWIELLEANEDAGADPTLFIPLQYRDQMQWQIRSCDPKPGETHARREWCDFWGYYPGLPSVLQRVPRDDERIAELEQAVVKINGQIEASIARMRRPPTEWDTTPYKSREEAEDDSMITDADVAMIERGF